MRSLEGGDEDANGSRWLLQVGGMGVVGEEEAGSVIISARRVMVVCGGCVWWCGVDCDQGQWGWA